MNVQLISKDPSLDKLCREILTECECVDWSLSQTSPSSCSAGADLYIWDEIWDDKSSPQLSPAFSQYSSMHVVLLRRDDVEKFRENTDKVDAVILLKPVTRASLSSLIGFAASAAQGRRAGNELLKADRDEILQCLIESNLQLQQYDQDRTNFVTRAVHDFRAPLTATAGYCGLLLNQALGPITEEQREVLQRMQHSTKRLSRAASAMFDLGVGRYEKRQPDLRPGDLREAVEQAVHEITPLADAKDISISVDLTSEPAIVYLEPSQIEQVLLNLLDNACKFTPRDGEIEVREYPYFWERRVDARFSNRPPRERRQNSSTTPNSYRIDIRDSGPQIPNEYLPSIFEEYTSYTGGQDRSGGGLGLAICKMIIRTHDGALWLENTNFGPRFSFVIPVRSGTGLMVEQDTDLN
jgi:signal transduction histidine kinase